MRALSSRYDIARHQMYVWIMIGLSVVIGILAGYQANLTPKLIFRGVVLCNIFLLGYLVLMRSVISGVLFYFYALIFLKYFWRIIIPGLWPDIDISRMLFVFIWLVFLTELIVGRRNLLPRTAAEVAMLGVLGAILLSILTSGKLVIRQVLNGYGIPYAMFVIGKNLFSDKKTLDRFVFWFAVPLSLYFPATTIFEHYGMHQFVFPKFVVSPDIIGKTETIWGSRAMGAFIQPVATGSVMIGIYALGLYSLSRLRGFLPRLYTILISVITPVAVFFTYTRSVYLGYVTALLCFFFFSKRLRLLALIAVVIMALTVIGNWSNVATEDRAAGGVATRHTAIIRVALVTASFQMFMDRPGMGVGFARFVSESKPYLSQVRSTILGYKEAELGTRVNQHNQFLSILTEVGILGFLPFALMYFFMFRMMARAYRIKCDCYDSEFVAAVWAVWAAYVSQVMFIEPRFFEFMNAFPFMFAGIIVGGYQRATTYRHHALQDERRRGREGTVR